MKQEFEAKVTTLTDSLDLERARRKRRQNARFRPAVYSILASLGIFGGISALFVGLVFVVIHGVLSADVIFNKVGTGLLIVAIPMILLGSIFIDEIEGKK
jgi:hypothetical protein